MTISTNPKKTSRHRDREKALKILYQLDVNQIDPKDGLDLFAINFQSESKLSPFCEALVLGVKAHQSEIDSLLSQHSSHWKLDRMSYVDRNILRIAVFEMIHRADVPPKVSINEAIELSKAYGAMESSSFINGILDSIFHSINLQKS